MRAGSTRRLLALGALVLALSAPLAAAQEAGAPAAPPLFEEPIISSTQTEVAITATFSGADIVVYGAVSRDRLVAEADGRLDVIIIVEGPSEPLIVRRKERIAGLWINAAAIRIGGAPSFYGVASTRPLSEILIDQDDATYGVSIDRAVFIAGVPVSAPDVEAFRQAVIRLRRRAGLYVELPEGVVLERDTLFTAQFELPANIAEGEYVATVHLVREGRILGSEFLEIDVQRAGLEEFLFEAATESPTLYALGTLFTALFAGYAASEIFRRLRRG